MKKSELRQIIKEELQTVLSEYGLSNRQKFKDQERNAGVEDEDPQQQRDMMRKNKGIYVKASKGGYMPIIHHDPRINGKTDGKLYRKNKKTGGFFPVKK